MYFDYCREAIRLAWVWCLDNDVLIATQDRETLIDQLVGALEQGMEKWLGSPFEDGPSPSLVIEADRRRVPLASGVLIEGIDQRVPESHILDCNCPICLMMADGSMGPSFSQFDGHHLELDDEFAFSMIETYDEWAGEHGESIDEFQDSDSDDVETEEADSVGYQPTGSFGSAWSGVRRDQPIPGDRQGKLMMAFMVAEIVGILEGRGDPKGDIVRLNEAFVKFRTSEDSKRNRQATKFKKFLESLANRYPELISKSADLQSCIDEAMRALTG